MMLKKIKLKAKLEAVDTKIADFESQVPADWKTVSVDYQKHLKALSKEQRAIAGRWMTAIMALKKP